MMLMIGSNLGIYKGSRPAFQKPNTVCDGGDGIPGSGTEGFRV